MNESRLDTIERLFHEALERDPRERPAFLDVQCAGDPELRNAVERLLEHDRDEQGTGSFLTSPIVRTDTRVSDRPETAGPPEFPGEYAIPGYRLLNQLGHGGMGVVYKTEQLGLGRPVALKMLLAVSPVTGELLERFRSEAATLARLHHPNIVQIYEVGEWRGRPYFAMEYVPGPSLAERLDGLPQSQLPTARLVEVLARAVHAVHSQGIVHRDLKPANILFAGDPVARQPAPGGRHSRLEAIEFLIPKITDFGVAKDITSTRGLTQTGQTMGTPSYMAPEQARGEGNEIGPAADIYSLGAMLYELLTGRPPFAASNPAEVFTRLLTEEPLSPARLVPRLSRDLETICLKCLEKDPRRRYATALDLAEDLHASQTGTPIKARPISWPERTWRWCRRQPLTAAALAAVAVLIVALVATVLVYDARLQQALAQTRQTADDERQRIVKLEIDIGTRELDEGDAFRALLWFADALEHEEGDEQTELPHRRRIAATLSQLPELLELNCYDQPVIQSRMGPDGSQVVTAGADGTIQVWNVSSGQRAAPDFKHDSAVELAEFGRGGRLLATATRDGTVNLWDMASGRVVQPAIRLGGQVRRIAFPAEKEGLLIQAADNSVRLWETATGKVSVLSGLPRSLRYSSLSEDGSAVFAWAENSKAFVLKVATGTKVDLNLPGADGATKAAFSSDGRRLAVADAQNAVWLWDVVKSKPLGEPLKHARPVSYLCFSKECDRLLTGSADGTAQLWQIGKSEQPVPLPRHEPALDFAQFGFNGTRVVTVAGGRRPRVWDCATGKALTPRLMHGGLPGHVWLAPDGPQVLVAEAQGHLRMWQLRQVIEDKKRLADWPVSELALLAQVFSGHHIDESGAIAALSPGDLRGAWKKLRPMLTSPEPHGSP